MNKQYIVVLSILGVFSYSYSADFGRSNTSATALSSFVAASSLSKPAVSPPAITRCVAHQHTLIGLGILSVAGTGAYAHKLGTKAGNTGWKAVGVGSWQLTKNFWQLAKQGSTTLYTHYKKHSTTRASTQPATPATPTTNTQPITDAMQKNSDLLAIIDTSIPDTNAQKLKLLEEQEATINAEIATLKQSSTTLKKKAADIIDNTNAAHTSQLTSRLKSIHEQRATLLSMTNTIDKDRAALVSALETYNKELEASKARLIESDLVSAAQEKTASTSTSDLAQRNKLRTEIRTQQEQALRLVIAHMIENNKGFLSSKDKAIIAWAKTILDTQERH